MSSRSWKFAASILASGLIVLPAAAFPPYRGNYGSSAPRGFTPTNRGSYVSNYNPGTGIYTTTSFGGVSRTVNPATGAYAISTPRGAYSMYNPATGTYTATNAWGVTRSANPVTGISTTAPYNYYGRSNLSRYDSHYDRWDGRHHDGYSQNSYRYGNGYDPYSLYGGFGAYGALYNPYSFGAAGGYFGGYGGSPYANSSDGGSNNNAPVRNNVLTPTYATNISASNPQPVEANALTAFGLPNVAGVLQWPLAFRLMPPAQKQELADRTETLFTIVTSQAVNEKPNRVMVREAVHSVAQLHDWLRSRRSNMAEGTYLDGEVFLLKLNRTLDAIGS